MTTKKEIIHRVKTKLAEQGIEITVSGTEAAINAYESVLAEALKEPGDKVRTHLGTFEVARVEEKTRAIPRPDRSTVLKTVPAHDKLRFRPSEHWKESANG